MFNHCENLTSLPNISVWNVTNVEDMNYMFQGWKNISSVPDFSKWKAVKLRQKNGMFDDCDKLGIKPNIKGKSDWFDEL